MRSAGTRAMAERLAALAAAVDHRSGVYSPEQMVAFYDQMEPPPDLRSQVLMRARRAQALLLAGRTEEAVAEFDQLRQLSATHAELFKPDFVRSLGSLAAIAWLRLAEQQNCVDGHTAESCILPIRGGGVHRRPQAAREAMARYRQLLDADPEDVTARWLLNVAAMAAGDHPQGVPEAWRIAPEVFASEYPLARFTDVAPAAGVAVTGLSGGVAAEDFDGDGLLDLMVSSWGLRDPLRFFHNRGDGSFEERTEAAGLAGITGGLNLVHADYDNDGFADVFVLRGAWMGVHGRHPGSLLRNRGVDAGGQVIFDDVTEAAGVLGFFPTQTAAWGDFDADGWLDLFVGAESTGTPAQPCRLFRNRGRGADGQVTFEDVAAASGAAVVGFVKGSVWGDYDNDGRLDLYVSRLGQPNVLLRNQGPDGAGVWQLRDVTAEAGVGEPLFSFPTWFWDYDNDGWLDLFASGYPPDFLTAEARQAMADQLGLPTSAEHPRLYRNQGDGTFADVTVEVGLDHVLYTMGSNFGDLDNDGFADLYLGTGIPDLRGLIPNRMFRNDAGRRFQDVTTAGGFGHLQKGHAVAFADFDNDGDQDVYAVLGGAYSGDVYPNVLFENPGGGGHWLTLRLEGRQANRSALGARLHLTLTGPGGQRQVRATVGTGGSFGSQSLQQEIGLGDATRIQRLEVIWPGSGTVQTFENLAVDRVLLLREGDAEPQTLTLPRFRIGHPAGGAAAHHQH